MNGLLNSRHLYTRFLIGQSQSYDVSSANQEQGGKWICRPHMIIYARWLAALMRAVCYLAAYIDDNFDLWMDEAIFGTSISVLHEYEIILSTCVNM